MKLKLGIPKGSLENATVDLFRKAGFNIATSSSRESVMTSNATKCMRSCAAVTIPA